LTFLASSKYLQLCILLRLAKPDEYLVTQKSAFFGVAVVAGNTNNCIKLPF
jgi:hypothetical protein